MKWRGGRRSGRVEDRRNGTILDREEVTRGVANVRTGPFTVTPGMWYPEVGDRVGHQVPRELQFNTVPTGYRPPDAFMVQRRELQRIMPNYGRPRIR